MSNYLIFGGTREGVDLARALSQAGHEVTVSVATDYGALMLEGLPIRILTGRMDVSAMRQEMERGGYSHILDATHPYAAEVTKTIRAAAEQVGLPYERILRPDSQAEGECLEAATPTEAAQRLQALPGNILLTTGSKDLAIFSTLPDYQERVWVRILASEASLHQALSLGYPPNHIIAMHGPFSTELNIALLRQFSICTLVTKRSGRAGGFQEKAEAAKRAGARLLVIDRPQQETGLTLEQAIEKYR